MADDEQWGRLRRAMGDPEWAAKREYETRVGRRRNEDALDAAIAEWTRPQGSLTLMEKLQAAGVPAGMVSQGQDLNDNAPPEVARVLPRHAVLGSGARDQGAGVEEGESVSWSIPAKMSETPIAFGKYSNIGEDNGYVFGSCWGCGRRD